MPALLLRTRQFPRRYTLPTAADGLALADVTQLDQSCLRGQPKHFLDSFSGHSTALSVLAAQFLPEIFANLGLCQLRISQVLTTAEVGFCSREYNFTVRNCIFDLGVPLHYKKFTTFLALTNEDGSTTEKAITNTSVLG